MPVEGNKDPSGQHALLGVLLRPERGLQGERRSQIRQTSRIRRSCHAVWMGTLGGRNGAHHRIGSFWSVRSLRSLNGKPWLHGRQSRTENRRAYWLAWLLKTTNHGDTENT